MIGREPRASDPTKRARRLHLADLIDLELALLRDREPLEGLLPRDAAIREEIGTWDDLLQDDGVQKIRIKMSGCPNGCGLHHIANIGFHGAAIKGPDGQQVPAYEMFLGGNYGDNRVEDSRIGTRIPRVKVPAKQVPRVVRDVATYYKNNRQEAEGFNQFLDRVGLEELTLVALEAQRTAETIEAGSDMYIDWDRLENYVLERGEGECAV